MATPKLMYGQPVEQADCVACCTLGRKQKEQQMGQGTESRVAGEAEERDQMALGKGAEVICGTSGKKAGPHYISF